MIVHRTWAHYPPRSIRDGIKQTGRGNLPLILCTHQLPTWRDEPTIPHYSEYLIDRKHCLVTDATSLSTLFVTSSRLVSCLQTTNGNTELAHSEDEDDLPTSSKFAHPTNFAHRHLRRRHYQYHQHAYHLHCTT
uniref:Uncharacterized protein n=1 Tax=Physcomitrium patens TaxID=3218 RepID=A0A2K1KFT8_PHYPA|nr:hypothetical protein PHYPA_009018 [Physcomitrium patens]